LFTLASIVPQLLNYREEGARRARLLGAGGETHYYCRTCPAFKSTFNMIKVLVGIDDDDGVDDKRENPNKLRKLFFSTP
jgi:hypothetical protein